MHMGILVLFTFVLETTLYKIEVKIKQGTLIGTTSTTVFDGRLYYAFYGVPYAQPPIKKLRFKEPIAPKTWTRPYDASMEYHGACAQAHIVHKHGVYGIEDCLYLNIFTPTLPKNINSRLPVIVWIHGYAFTSSFSHIHGGDFFIENNVIFITLAHRIGAFGFINITNANMGLKDIVMALKWIKRNIVKFGGDKNKITLMGSGSGATFISLLLMTDSQKLFSKIILQSGSLFDVATFRGNSEFNKNKLLDNLREKGSRNINTASTRDIIAASQKIYDRQEVVNSQRTLIPFMPIIEDKTHNPLLTKTPKEHFDNIDYINKPMLIGMNSQESISEVIPFLHRPNILNSFEDSFKYMVPFSDGCKWNSSSNIYKTVANITKVKYFRSGFTLENFLRYTSDLYKYPIVKFIKTVSNIKENKMFVYKFNYNGNFNIFKITSTAGSGLKVKGASHGDEICYLMKCEPLIENYLKTSSDTNNLDNLFIRKIVKLWANFAKSGNPTPVVDKNNFTWPQFSLKGNDIVLIGREIKPIKMKLENNMYEFWNKLYDKYYAKSYCDHINHDEL